MKRAITVLAAAILCAAIGLGAYTVTGRLRRGRVYEELKQTAAAPVPTPEPTEAPAPTERPAAPSSPTPAPTPEPYVSPVDFESLWAIDPNVFAWIEIPGTNVDYPVVKHPTDDTFYLNHTIEGYRGYPGAIFAYGYTAADFSQFNTILYGHNMASGSMFADLNRYRDGSYLDGRRTVTIYTPEAEYSYTVFAFVYYDDRLIDSYFDQQDPADRQAFLDSLFDTGSRLTYVLDDVEVGVDSHILTLETCHGVSSERTLVLAVRDDEET